MVVAGTLLKTPPPGYVPPGPKVASTAVVENRSPREMLGTWQYFALVALMFGSSQSGLLVIANATKMLTDTAKASGATFFVENAWLLAAFGGVVNAVGRVGTGFYSDRIGRTNAYALNGTLAALGLMLMPVMIEQQNVFLLFLVVGIAFWQYGGGLSLIPALTADFFGPKNMGTNYGLVFLGWGLAFLVPLSAGYIKDLTGRTDTAFYISAGLLIACVVLSKLVKKPTFAKEST